MKILVIVVMLLSGPALAGRFAPFKSQLEVHYMRFAKEWAERGVNVFTAVDKRGDSMLHIAARAGNLVAARYWLANGADVNALNHQKESPLYLAIYNENRELAYFFLRKGAQFTENIEVANPVIAAAYRRDTKTLKKMLKGGADPNVTDEKNLGRTPLGVAYVTSVIKLLLATDGIDVNKPDIDGYTALHRAASRGYIDSVKLLINAGADPNAIDENGKTPADFAEETMGSVKYSEREYREVIELLRSLEFNFEPV